MRNIILFDELSCRYSVVKSSVMLWYNFPYDLRPLESTVLAANVRNQAFVNNGNALT